MEGRPLTRTSAVHHSRGASRPPSASHLSSQDGREPPRAHRCAAGSQYVTVTVIVSLYVPALGVV
jgi:hypothetical protein